MHDKDESMHLGIGTKQSSKESKQKNISKDESSEFADKKRLIEIYLIISGLLISGEQITSSLLSTQTNTSGMSLNLKSYTLNLISNVYIAFILLIVFILYYYYLCSWEKHPPLLLTIMISLLFGYLISIISVMYLITSGIENETEIILTKLTFFVLWMTLFYMSMFSLTTRKTINKTIDILSTLIKSRGHITYTGETILNYFIRILLILVMFTCLVIMGFSNYKF